MNNTLVDDITRIVRVGDPGCGILCTTLSQYRIRARETTVGVPRFNNSATQVTVLMTQNVSNETVNATAFFYDTAGTLVHSQPYAIPPKGLNVVPLTT